MMWKALRNEMFGGHCHFLSKANLPKMTKKTSIWKAKLSNILLPDGSREWFGSCRRSHREKMGSECCIEYPLLRACTKECVERSRVWGWLFDPVFFANLLLRRNQYWFVRLGDPNNCLIDTPSTFHPDQYHNISPTWYCLPPNCSNTSSTSNMSSKSSSPSTLKLVSHLGLKSWSCLTPAPGSMSVTSVKRSPLKIKFYSILKSSGWPGCSLVCR